MTGVQTCALPIFFTPDHGEYGGAHHMMMEKWHSAYEEFTHVPLVVRFPQSLHQVPGGLRQVSEPTCHADILPTVLGLAGIKGDERERIQRKLRVSHPKTLTPVGADLSGLLLGEEDSIVDPATGEEREGTLFITHDTISAPLDGDRTAESGPGEDLTSYDVYLATIDKLIRTAEDGDEVGSLAPGSVRQPNHVHSVVDRHRWKLVRYFDPADGMGDRSNNQWELYDLNTDPTEEHNLLVFDAAGDAFPTVVADDQIPEAQPATADAIKQKAVVMNDLLIRLENRMLKEPTS